MNKERMAKQVNQVLEGEEHDASKHQAANTTMRGDKTLQDFLYEDDKRRREENQKKKEHLDKTRDMPKDKKYVNENCDKYVVQRFDRDLEQTFQDVADEEASSDDEEGKNAEDGKLGNKKLKRLLLSMGFIPHNMGPNTVEHGLCHDLWAIL